MAWKTRDGEVLELRWWQKALTVLLLLALMIGVGCVFYFFGGYGSALGLLVGVALLAVGTLGLLEIGRAGGARK